MEEKNINAAIRLARLFTEEIDLPGRLKEKENKKEKNKNSQKNKENSGVEQRFQDTIKSWDKFINTMTSRVEKSQASRFLNLTPNVESDIISVAYCKDFQDFTDYFILRRDKEMCDDLELGQLAQLHMAFQREIEQKLSTRIA